MTLRVMLAHNRYQQLGGEDSVLQAESALLKNMGHAVDLYAEDNRRVSEYSSLSLAARTIWSRESKEALKRRLAQFRPDIVHFHNTFMLMSPSAYYACSELGIPVVQTLHNFRLICPAATLYRNGTVCEKCIGKFLPTPALFHSCYRSSRMATAVTGGMLSVHRIMRTWTDRVDVYVALTDFARQKFIEGGLPPERLVVKPNFLAEDPGVGHHEGGFALFVGRLTPEKGVETLLDAWEVVGSRLPLRIVGVGPLADLVRTRSERQSGIEYLGAKSKNEVIDLMKAASILILPSQWYEGFPMVLVEAFATGLPVIASNLGSMASIVEDGRTGFHFRPGDHAELAAKVLQAVAFPKLSGMRVDARSEYLGSYTAQQNYEHLIAVYELARERARGKPCH